MSDDAIQLRDQVGVLRRRWPLVVATVAVTVGIGLLVSLLQTPMYAASTEVQLGVDPASDSASLTTEQVATEAREVTAFDSLEQVIDTLGLDDTEAELLETVTVQPDESGAAVLTISATRDDADEAAAIANELAGTYLELSASLDADRVDAIDERVANLDARIAAVTRQIATAPTSQAVTELQSERRRLQAELDLLVQVRAGITTSDASGAVLTPAFAPDSPSSPRPLATAGLAAVVGLLLGVAVAYLRDYFDDVVRDDRALHASLPGAPVLGRIPHWRRFSARQPASLRSPASPVSEAYRAMGINVRALLDEWPHGRRRHASEQVSGRVLLIASAVPSEGKTSTAVNLAVVTAQAGLRVVLVDGDLRRPRISAVFGLDPVYGLSDVLAGRATVQQSLADVGEPNLLVLPGGCSTAPVPGVLASPRRTRLLDELAAEADLVVVDSTVVLGVADALELAKDADLTVLAVREAVSRGRWMTAAVLRLEQVGASVAGIVVTDARRRRA